MVMPAALQPGMVNAPRNNNAFIDEELALLQEEEDILTGKWQPSASYGEIATKHAQNLPDVAKATGGTLLQYLGEMGQYSPQLNIASTLANVAMAKKGGAGKAGADIRHEAQRDIAQNQPYIRPEDKGKRYISDVARSVEEMSPGLAGSLVTRSPFPMLGQAGVQGFTGSYGEQRDAGRTPTQSAGAAFPSAAAEVAFEYPVAKILTMGGSSFLKRLIGSVVGEGVSESATEAVQAGIEAGTISPDMTLKEYLNRVGYAGAVGMGAGGVVSIPAQIADAATRGEKAEPEGEFYTPTQDVIDMFGGQEVQLALPAPDKRLALPAPDYSQAPFKDAPIIAGQEGLRFQTLEEKQKIEAEEQRKIDLGIKDAPRLSPQIIERLRNARVKQEAEEAQKVTRQQERKVKREESALIKQEQKEQSALKRDTLFNFIAENGGIKKDDGGDLIQSLGGVNPLIPGKGRMVRESGKSLDYMREAAVEGGYLPEDATIDDLLQAIDSEARGEPVRKLEAIIEPTQQDYINDLMMEADKAGVDTKGKSPEQILTELEQVTQRDIAEAEDPMLTVDRIEAPEEDFDIPFYSGIDPTLIAKLIPNKYKGMTKSEFLGEPRRVGAADSKYLKPREYENLKDVEKVPFMGGEYSAKYGDDHFAVYDGDKVIANYNYGDTLIVDKKYRRKGIGEELVYQWRIQNPDKPLAKTRNVKSQKLQEKVYDRIQSELQEDKGGGRGTLYSGFDPSLISNLLGTKQERAEFYAGLKKVPKGARRLGKNIGGGFGTLFLSIDDALRIRAKIHKMPTISKIADMLYGGTQDSYGEAVRTRQTTNHNKVERILSPIRKSKGMLDRTIYLIQNPKEIRINRSHEDNAAAGIAKLLADERQYMIDAGVEVGEVEGYFPRVYDLEKILRNENAFLSAAKKAYKATYPELSKEEINAKAEAWLANIKLNNAGVSTDVGDLSRRSGVPKPSSLKERVLTKESDAILKEFLVQDPQEVLQQHFIGTAKKAEFQRRFNTEDWAALKDGMIAEADALPTVEEQQAGHDAIRKTIADIMAATGNNTGSLPQGVGDALSWLKMFGAMSMLPHAVLTALPEVVMPALRAGDVRESFAAFTTAWRALIKDKSYAEQKEIAEEVIGVAAKAVSDMAAEQRMGGELGTAATRKLMAKYFTATGLHGFTEGMRIASTGVGMRYLARLSKEMAKSPVKAKLYMRDLGIDPKEAEGFANWVLENSEGKLKPSQLQTDNKYADMYKRALTRFVDQSVIKPDAAEKPRYASHKIGSLFYYLQSFIYGFQKNVLLRQAKNVKRAATEKGLTPANRAAMAAPMILTPIILGALQYGLGDLRDKILDSEAKKDMPEERKVARALSRTGYYGQLDPWINLFAGLKYRREPATTLAGPVFGGLLDTFASVANLTIANSKNTNTQERKAAQQFWRTMAKPAMVTMFTAMPGTFRVPLIQMVSHPQVEEEFIQAVAGKKKGN